jgi:hypothetical protein
VCAGASLRAQFERRLKEIHIQSHRAVQLGHLAIPTLAFEPIVANQLTDD